MLRRDFIRSACTGAIAVLATTLTACSPARDNGSNDASQQEDADTAQTPAEPKAPRYVRVPNVTADTVEDATATLEALGLAVATVNDWSDRYTEGHISAQCPTGYVSEGTTMTLTVSLGHDPYTMDTGPETRNVPDVRGYAVDEALEALEDHWFGSVDVDGPEDGVVASFEVTGSAPLSSILHVIPASDGSYDATLAHWEQPQ